MNVLVHGLHLTAAVVWVVGMVFLAFVLNPLLRQSLAREARMPLIAAVGRRFKFVEGGCLLLLITTGLYKLWERALWGPVFAGTWGTVLGVKLGMVGLMVVLAIFHSFLWGPRLARGEWGPEEWRRATKRLVFWARVNLILALGVLFSAAALRTHAF